MTNLRTYCDDINKDLCMKHPVWFLVPGDKEEIYKQIELGHVRTSTTKVTSDYNIKIGLRVIGRKTGNWIMFSQGYRGYCKRGNKHSDYLKEGILWPPEYSLTTLKRGSQDSSVGIVTRVQPSRDAHLSLLHSVHTGFVVQPTISRRFKQNWRPKSRIASAQQVTVSSKQFLKFPSSKNSPVRYHKASARLRDARFVVQKRSRWSNTLLGPLN